MPKKTLLLIIALFATVNTLFAKPTTQPIQTVAKPQIMEEHGHLIGEPAFKKITSGPYVFNDEGGCLKAEFNDPRSMKKLQISVNFSHPQVLCASMGDTTEICEKTAQPGLWLLRMTDLKRWVESARDLESDPEVAAALIILENKVNAILKHRFSTVTALSSGDVLRMTYYADLIHIERDYKRGDFLAFTYNVVSHVVTSRSMGYGFDFTATDPKHFKPMMGMIKDALKGEHDRLSRARLWLVKNLLEQSH